MDVFATGSRPARPALLPVTVAGRALGPLTAGSDGFVYWYRRWSYPRRNKMASVGTFIATVIIPGAGIVEVTYSSADAATMGLDGSTTVEDYQAKLDSGLTVPAGCIALTVAWVVLETP